MLVSKNLHKKSREVSFKARSTPASLSFKDQATKHTTVKWSIVKVFDFLINAHALSFYSTKTKSTYLEDVESALIHTTSVGQICLHVI